ncbi:nitrous oxide reductase family maturation protein NosD [Terriglobus sp. TAA 43]|uniref:right-handed parallel beta-helix repeat-containing protein n=1 Tax=Terriglobus sp. TAA 43 TaxID=278961 RepID=UPI0006489B83|nr:right-handed parallel beta-helix repeat-containing protein [Terriglobus sp. TAA 43]
MIHVPADAPTVQQAIAATSNGDTVSVAPGTYSGVIDFAGKAITVQGTASGVIFQGASAGPVVLFHHGEGRGSVLDNVTVQGGAATAAIDAGGVWIDHASPTVKNSTITGNSDCGIGIHFGAPLITGNTITANNGGRTRGCIPLYTTGNIGIAGGGLTIEGAPAGGQVAEISDNTIAQNTAVWSAAGITVQDAGHVVIRNNVITANTSNGAGSAIALYKDVSAEIVQNLIYANVLNPTLGNPAYADIGAGLNLDLTAGSQHSTRTVVVNNTFADNVLQLVSGARMAGSQVLLLNAYDSISFYNNIIASSDSLSAVDCKRGTQQPIPLPVFDHNLVFTQGTAGSSFSADCSSPAGTNGNLFVDPQFVARSGNAPYQVAKVSPAVDSGNNNAPSLLPTDLLGNNRLQNATGTPSAVIDRGAYEVAGAGGTLPPAAGLSLSVNPASLSLPSGSSGVVQVTTVVTGALQGPVQLACTNLPAYATCVFGQSSLAINGAGTYNTNLTLAVNNSTASVRGSWAVLAAVMMPGVLLGLRKRSRLVALTVLLMSCSVLFLSGCKDIVSIIPASYNVVITGTDSTSGQTARANLPLTVTP